MHQKEWEELLSFKEMEQISIIRSSIIFFPAHTDLSTVLETGFM